MDLLVWLKDKKHEFPQKRCWYCVSNHDQYLESSWEKKLQFDMKNINNRYEITTKL